MKCALLCASLWVAIQTKLLGTFRLGQVEIPVGAVEPNDVEVRILLDEADEVAELGDGRRRDRVRSDVRRTPPREATQIPGRSSPADRSSVGRRPPVCHNGPPGATRPSPKDDPSDAPEYFAFSASVPTPRG